jgi:hypothetical protein
MANLDGANDLEKRTDPENGLPVSPEAIAPPEGADVSEKPGARVGLSISQVWIVIFG